MIFGEEKFRNEISWKRSAAHNDAKTSYGNISDIILFYSKTLKNNFNKQYTPYSEKYLTDEWNELPSGRFYKAENMLDPQGKMKEYDFHGTLARWRTSKEKFEEYWSAPQTEVPSSHGRIKLGKDGFPTKRCRIVFLDELPGVPLQDMWDDIPYLAGRSKESLGYPTQKPQALLERIIQASSNEGDVVADFFCGCGTTIAAAQKLNRKWIGVDISHLAVGLIRKRLIDTHGEKIVKTFTVDGLPKDVGSARALALAPQGRMHFQDWVIETLLGGVANEKKTGDGGYDGYTTLEVDKGKKEIVLIEVKSGGASIAHFNRFCSAVKKQNASGGIWVCFKDEVTKGVRSDAKDQGYFRDDVYGTRFDKIQIISVEDLLDGKLPDLPRSYETGPFKKAEKAIKKSKGQKELF